MAVARLNWAHPSQGLSATQIVWGSFLCTHLFELSAELIAFPKDPSSPSELGSHTMHLPEECGVAAESLLVVNALLKDLAA